MKITTVFPHAIAGVYSLVMNVNCDSFHQDEIQSIKL